MSEWKTAPFDQRLARQLEEQAYESVAAELASGVRKEGLWMKAVADAEGDEPRAKALYIRYRAHAILDDAFDQLTAPPGDIPAIYVENGAGHVAAKRDGRVECFRCHSVNFTDLGRRDPRCGKCRVALA
jgi:hypothetical protein